MNCPSCGHALKQARSGDKVVDVCPKCRGIWFDPGELQATIDWLLASPGKVPDAGIAVTKGIVSPERLREPARACPDCGSSMRKFNYAYDSNVILDRCPSCSGIWADGGEIYRLASYNKGHPKLDALGASIVEHENERARFQEMVEGASGAVAGVMGAYFVLYPSASIKTLVIYRVMDIPAFIYIGAWLLVQLVSGLLFAGADLQSGVAWFAHIGGFICGAGLAWPAKRAVRRHEKIA